MPNPLLAFRDLPDFESLSPEQAVPAVTRLLAEAATGITQLEAEAQPTWEGLMKPLEVLGEPLEFAWGLIGHMMSVMNSEAWRSVHEELQPEVVAFGLRCGQSVPLYRCMQALAASEAFNTLSLPQQRVLEASMRSAEQSGVGLTETSRARFNIIQTELASLATQFSNHLLDATKAFTLPIERAADVAGFPPSLLAATAAASGEEATPESGPWTVTLEGAIFMPFMQYCQNRQLRESVYRAYVTRASDGDLDNCGIIRQILKLKGESAALLGYATVAELSLSRKMADSTTAVYDLLGSLRDAAWPFAQQEQQVLSDYAAAHGAPVPLRNWDIAYWSEAMRQEQFDYSSEDFRPYFQFPRVLEGLFSLATRLFDVQIEPSDGAESVWHADVKVFHVKDQDGTPLASFYLDPYSRPATKRGGAWVNPVQPRKLRPDGALQLPVAYLVCNQANPTADAPSLMSLDEVTTLFHEFGHALQHMLTTVAEPGASGLYNIEWDAVELASQFMENWCYEFNTVERLSAHIESGASVPRELFDKADAARTYRAGATMMRQLFFSVLDMRLHDSYDPAGEQTATQLKESLAADYSTLPLLPEDRFLCGFAHIFGGGYAAGYYSYKWAEVLSADAFAAFEEAGLGNEEAVRAMGRRYRDTILALGGGTHPMDVFQQFRGRAPSPQALLRHSGLAVGLATPGSA